MYHDCRKTFGLNDKEKMKKEKDETDRKDLKRWLHPGDLVENKVPFLSF